jgi:hypothetical protein
MCSARQSRAEARRKKIVAHRHGMDGGGLAQKRPLIEERLLGVDPSSLIQNVEAFFGLEKELGAS